MISSLAQQLCFPQDAVSYLSECDKRLKQDPKASSLLDAAIRRMYEQDDKSYMDLLAEIAEITGISRYTVDILEGTLLSEEEKGDDKADDERLPFEEAIEVRNLSFRFDNGTTDTLHDLSLTIRKGEKVGINGESGVGKTTLLNILLGLYRPTAGGVYIDGRELDESTLRKWQNSIGYVSQNTFLADSTIVANIAFGCEEGEVDMERVEAVVEAASLTEFVASLPKGLDTRIGECGALLSGGQRQRIGIARALYKQADTLFFDEATSSLDNATEQSINQAIERLSATNSDLTIVVVAHRDSSLDYCDRVITMERK